MPLPRPRSPGRALGAALALALALGCGGAQRGESGPPVRLIVPALDGGEIAVHAHRGEPVILHLFTTGALPAQVDVEQLQALHTARQGQLTIIGIALDELGHRQVSPWRDAMGVRYLVGLATPELLAGRSALGPLHSVPTTIVLRADGTVARRIERQLAPGELEALLDEL